MTTLSTVDRHAHLTPDAWRKQKQISDVLTHFTSQKREEGGTVRKNTSPPLRQDSLSELEICWCLSDKSLKTKYQISTPYPGQLDCLKMSTTLSVGSLLPPSRLGGSAKLSVPIAISFHTSSVGVDVSRREKEINAEKWRDEGKSRKGFKRSLGEAKGRMKKRRKGERKN